MATDKKPRSPRFEMTGGALCLDFLNTLGDRPRCGNDRLAGYGDLLDWGLEAGTIDGTTARELARLAAREPERAERAFDEAIELREQLYAIFSALAAGRPAPRAGLSTLNLFGLEQLVLSVAGIAPALGGVKLGTVLRRRLDPELFRRLVLLVLLVVGLSLVWRIL